MPDVRIPARRAAIIAALDEIKDPCSVANGTPMGLAEMGLIKALDFGEDGEVTIELRLTSPFCHMIGFFKVEAQARLMALPGVTRVVLSADQGLDWSPGMISAAGQARRSALAQTKSAGRASLQA